MNLAKGKSDFVDRVINAIGRDELDLLSETDQLRFKIVSSIEKLIMESNSNEYIHKKIKALYPDENIQRSTFYRMRSQAEAIYGHSQKLNKEYMRAVALNMATKNFHKAMANGDFRAAAAANRNYNQASGILESDVDLPNAWELTNQIFIMKVVIGDEEIPIDLSNPKALSPEVHQRLIDAQEIPYEEVKKIDAAKGV